MEEELRGFGRDIESLDDEVESLLTDINGKESEYVARIKELERDLARGKQNNSEQKINIQNFKCLVEDKDKEMDKLWEALNQEKSQVSVKNEELKGKIKEFEELNGAKQLLEIEIQKLNSYISSGEQGFYCKIEILKKEIESKNRIIFDFKKKARDSEIDLSTADAFDDKGNNLKS